MVEERYFPDGVDNLGSESQFNLEIMQEIDELNPAFLQDGRERVLSYLKKFPFYAPLYVKFGDDVYFTMAEPDTTQIDVAISSYKLALQIDPENVQAIESLLMVMSENRIFNRISNKELKRIQELSDSLAASLTLYKNRKELVAQKAGNG